MPTSDLDPASNTYAVETTDLNKQLADAQSQRIQMEAFLRHADDPDSLPQVRNNPVIQALVQKQAEANAELAQAQVIYGANHPNVRKLQNQSNELGRAIKAQLSGVVLELRTNYRAAQAREQLLSHAVKGATENLSTLSQYNALKKQAQADRAISKESDRRLSHWNRRTSVELEQRSPHCGHEVGKIEEVA